MGNLEEFKNQPFDIVIQGGQSNADGNGRGKTKQPYEPCENVLYLNPRAYAEVVNYPDGTENMVVTYPESPIIEIARERSIGEGEDFIISDFSLSFAREYLRAGLLKKGRKLLIVRAAVGGTGFAKGHWKSDGILYKKLIELTDAAVALNPENKIVAFLWHQGECDAFEFPERSDEQRYKIHYDYLFGLFTSLTERYNVANLPIITGGLIEDWRRKFAAPCDAVEKAIKDASANMPAGAFAESCGLLSNDQAIGNGDDIHYCREALMELGRRYFEKYLECIGKSCK